MNPPESLLQAAHRDVDPTAALACADWYDEHDQPEQARLMRLSVRLEQLGPGHSEALAIELEVEKLRLWLRWNRNQYGVECEEALGHVYEPIARILPKWLRLADSSQFDRLVGAWFEQYSARSIWFLDHAESGEWLQSPIGAKVVGVRGRFHENCLRQLAHAAGRIGLIELDLDLRGCAHPSVAEMFFEGFETLQRLRLIWNQDLSELIGILGQSSHIRRLKHVELVAYQNPGSEGCLTEEQLAVWGDPSRGCQPRSFTAGVFQIPPQAMESFARSDCWGELQSLDLHFERIDLDTLLPLASLLQRDQLRSLRFAGRQVAANRYFDDFFFAASNALGLRKLNCEGDQIQAFNWSSLANWPGLRSVTDLSLGMQPQRREQLRDLIQSPYSRALQRLSIRLVLDESHLEIFTDGIRSEMLQSLEIWIRRNSPATVETLIRMLNSAACSRLRSLDLRYEFDDARLAYFAEHLDMPMLEKLAIEIIRPDPGRVRSLLESSRLPRLSIFDLSNSYEYGQLELNELPAGWYEVSRMLFIHPERLR